MLLSDSRLEPLVFVLVVFVKIDLLLPCHVPEQLLRLHRALDFRTSSVHPSIKHGSALRRALFVTDGVIPSFPRLPHWQCLKDLRKLWTLVAHSRHLELKQNGVLRYKRYTLC